MLPEVSSLPSELPIPPSPEGSGLPDGSKTSEVRTDVQEALDPEVFLRSFLERRFSADEVEAEGTLILTWQRRVAKRLAGEMPEESLHDYYSGLAKSAHQDSPLVARIFTAIIHIEVKRFAERSPSNKLNILRLLDRLRNNNSLSQAAISLTRSIPLTAIAELFRDKKGAFKRSKAPNRYQGGFHMTGDWDVVLTLAEARLSNPAEEGLAIDMLTHAMFGKSPTVEDFIGEYGNHGLRLFSRAVQDAVFKRLQQSNPEFFTSLCETLCDEGYRKIIDGNSVMPPLVASYEAKIDAEEARELELETAQRRERLRPQIALLLEDLNRPELADEPSDHSIDVSPYRQSPLNDCVIRVSMPNRILLTSRTLLYEKVRDLQNEAEDCLPDLAKALAEAWSTASVRLKELTDAAYGRVSEQRKRIAENKIIAFGKIIDAIVVDNFRPEGMKKPGNIQYWERFQGPIHFFEFISSPGSNQDPVHFSMYSLQGRLDEVLGNSAWGADRKLVDELKVKWEARVVTLLADLNTLCIQHIAEVAHPMISDEDGVFSVDKAEHLAERLESDFEEWKQLGWSEALISTLKKFLERKLEEEREKERKEGMKDAEQNSLEAKKAYFQRSVEQQTEYLIDLYGANAGLDLDECFARTEETDEGSVGFAMTSSIQLRSEAKLTLSEKLEAFDSITLEVGETLEEMQRRMEMINWVVPHEVAHIIDTYTSPSDNDIEAALFGPKLPESILRHSQAIFSVAGSMRVNYRELAYWLHEALIDGVGMQLALNCGTIRFGSKNPFSETEEERMNDVARGFVTTSPIIRKHVTPTAETKRPVLVRNMMMLVRMQTGCDRLLEQAEKILGADHSIVEQLKIERGSIESLKTTLRAQGDTAESEILTDANEAELQKLFDIFNGEESTRFFKEHVSS